jgi:homoserine kinase type II
MPRYGIPPHVKAAIPEFLDQRGIVASGVEEIEEGYENQSILVLTPASRFVIRRYSFRRPEEIPFEMEAILACAKRGFPVARPIPDRAGEYVRVLGDLPAALFEYVEGEHPEDGSRSDRRQVGAWLAQFHQASRGIHPTSTKPYDDFTELRRAEDLRVEFARRGYSDFHSDLDDFRRAHLPRLERAWPNLPHGIVHSDFNAGNLLLRAGQLVALLDFDTAYYGALVRDVADTILCWSDPHPGFEPDPLAEAEIVAGYDSTRRLMPGERDVLRSTILLACISDAIRTISLRIRLARAFATAKECHMYCRYLKLRDAARAT